jgi:predicted O-methyltransferase YrrM
MENSIVEVGSFYGRSTVALAFGSKNGHNVRVHAVDPHLGLAGITIEDSFEAMRTTLHSLHLRDLVQIHRSTSRNVARSWNKQNIGLLFIDALHGYKSVKDDFMNWAPHLANSGYVIFHDANQLGPNKWIRKLIRTSRHLVPLGLQDSMFIFQYVQEEADITEEEKRIWQDYLSILGRHYRFWLMNEALKLRREIYKLFKSLENTFHSSNTNAH